MAAIRVLHNRAFLGPPLRLRAAARSEDKLLQGAWCRTIRNTAPSLTFQGFPQLACALPVSEISGESTVYGGHVRGKQVAPPWLLDLTEHQQNQHSSVP